MQGFVYHQIFISEYKNKGNCSHKFLKIVKGVFETTEKFLEVIFLEICCLMIYWRRYVSFMLFPIQISRLLTLATPLWFWGNKKNPQNSLDIHFLRVHNLKENSCFEIVPSLLNDKLLIIFFYLNVRLMKWPWYYCCVLFP